MPPRYEDSVFLNVPFDLRYEPLLRALVFAVHDCGLVARCALEVDAGGDVRIENIYSLIEQSKYGIHDISRTGLERTTRLPRFNMPLELGIFLGSRRFGDARHRGKLCLILDRDPHRFHRCCSDLAGHDVRAHGNSVEGAITSVRYWLRNALPGASGQIPSGSRILERYQTYRRDLPAMCRELNLDPRDLMFNDLTTLVVAWLQENPW